MEQRPKCVRRWKGEEERKLKCKRSGFLRLSGDSAKRYLLDRSCDRARDTVQPRVHGYLNKLALHFTLL